MNTKTNKDEVISKSKLMTWTKSELADWVLIQISSLQSKLDHENEQVVLWTKEANHWRTIAKSKKFSSGNLPAIKEAMEKLKLRNLNADPVLMSVYNILEKILTSSE